MPKNFEVKLSKAVNGYKSTSVKRTFTCFQCQKEFIHYGEENLYKINGHIVCSYQCKQDFKKRRKEEERQRVIEEWKQNK